MGNFVSSLSRGSRALLVALAVACSNRVLPPLPVEPTIEPASIAATSDTVAMGPGESRQLVFYLRGSEGEAAPDAVVSFAILDDADTPGSGGARLSFSSALTDDEGVVTLQVIAGKLGAAQKPLEFKVEASAGSAPPLDIPIFVTTVAHASVEILPVFPDRPATDNSDIATNIYFYDDTSCASVSLDHPALPLRGVRPLPLGDPPATFTSVVTSGVHAVLGLAVDTSQKVVAKGCSDLLGGSLSTEQPMRVQLPLAWIYPSPVGSFRAVSKFSFATPLPGTVSAQETWQDLSDDACDPARLWLDCTIDALSGTSAEDPLDCQPVPGAEGPLGDLLAARRAPPGGSGTCASLSLDTKVLDLFPAASLDAIDLENLPTEIGNALTSLTIESSLTVTATGPKDSFNIDHDLTAIDLPNAFIHSPISMTALASPVHEAAFVSGVSQAGQLKISTASSPHGFTLELGSAARLTFATSSLKTRLGKGDVRTFVEALVNLATRNENGTTLRGCDALDSLLCAEVGQASGCLRAACLDGLAALIQRLDASFAALDGQDLDFFLSGGAPMVDRDGDGYADALGGSFSGTTSSGLVLPGLWSTSFKSRAGTTNNVWGSWTAERTTAPSL
jgi:hypothetical protein